MHLTKKEISLFFFFSFWLLLGYYAWYHQGKLSVLLDISFYLLCILIACIVLGIVCRGIINYLFYNKLGADLQLKHGLDLAVLNTLGNQLPFAGGFWAKGLFLRKVFRVPMLAYVAATVSLMCFFVVLFGFMGLVSLACLACSGDVSINSFLILGFSSMLLPALALFFDLKWPAIFSARWQDYFRRAAEGWRVLGSSHGMLLQLGLMQCLGILLYALRLYILFSQVERGIPFFSCLLFASSAILSQFVAVLPAGIGLREGVISGLGILLGYDFSSCLLVVSYDRLLDLLITGFLALLCLGRQAWQKAG